MSSDAVVTIGPGPFRGDVRVTVIIPAFNYAAFLPRAVESVLRQTFAQFELIIVDDGSTDDTAAVAGRFVESDQRVRYVFQPNAGLSAARNTGIRSARGDLVAFLDADDEWDPRFLTRCIEEMERLPSEFGVIACNTVLIDIDGRLIPTRRRGKEIDGREVTRKDLIMRTRFSADAVVARREVFETCGCFDEFLRSSEDRDMWIRIAARFRIYLIADSLVRVRRHGRNMSCHSDRMRANMKRVLLKAYRQESGMPWNLFFWLRVASFWCFQTSWMYHDERRASAALRDIVFSLVFWPFVFVRDEVGEPPFFRLRALIRFFRNALPQTKTRFISRKDPLEPAENDAR